MDLLARELGNWRTSNRSGPAYKGLADGIRMLIIDGRLPVGARLPSERALADALRVSRTTVTAAYAQLRDDGYLNARRGARSTTALPVATRIITADAATATASVNLAIAALPAPAAATLEAFSEATRQVTPYLHETGSRASPGSLPCAPRSPKGTARVAFPPIPTRSWSPPARCTRSA